MRNTPQYLPTRLALILFCTAVAFWMTGCSPARYNILNPILDSTKVVQVKQYPFAYAEPTIKKYDVVKVQFAGMNPTTTALLNSYGGQQFENKLDGSVDQPEQVGQQVDGEGNLDFPLIGKIKAEGKTKGQLRQDLTAKVTPILRDPFVYVELPKRGVTILGEIKNAGPVAFPKERANMLETLAAGGYTTEYADLKRVKIYREDANGNRSVGHIDLSGREFMDSPYFYPQPDDVIFIPALSEKRVRNAGQTYAQLATILVALASLTIALFN